MEEDRWRRLHVVWFHLHEILRQSEPIKTESRLIGAGSGKWDWLQRWGVNFLAQGKVLTLLFCDGYTILNLY